MLRLGQTQPQFQGFETCLCLSQQLCFLLYGSCSFKPEPENSLVMLSGSCFCRKGSSLSEPCLSDLVWGYKGGTCAAAGAVCHKRSFLIHDGRDGDSRLLCA